MPYFPFFCDIKDRDVLIIGGGKRALAKLEKLLPFAPRIRVIYPQVMEEICSIVKDGAEARCPQKEDFVPAPVFVVAASQDNAENRRIAAFCHRQHIPVNAVDTPDSCDFIFPALITRGYLSIGISTGGACPAITSQLKTEISDALSGVTEELLLWLEQLTPKLRSSIPEERQRGQVIRMLFTEGLRLERVLTSEEVQEVLKQCGVEV